MQNLLLNRMTNRIRQSLELQEILSVTAAEVRAFLKTDRVKIYRFEPDGSGQVIAESVSQNRLPSLLNLHFPAGDIPPAARELFVKVRQRSIVDIPAQRITLSRFEDVETTGDLTVEEVRSRSIEDILQRPVDPCHVEYLTGMGVQSSLVIPILYQKQLWGLLASHHSQPKTFHEEALQIIQMVTEQLSIAIGQSHLLSQSREQARREAFLHRISTLLHSSLNIEQILQMGLEAIVTMVQGSGGRLYLTPTPHDAAQLYTYGVQPRQLDKVSPTFLEEHPVWQHLLSQETEEQKQQWQLEFSSDLGLERSDKQQPTLKAVANIYEEVELETLSPHFHSTSVRSLLILPLQSGRQTLGCLSLFRNAIDTDILWAGKFNLDGRHDRVRNSFEAWRELKQNQAREWTSEDIELIWSSGMHLEMALMQNRLYQYERQQRLLVEMRNRELDVARTIAEEARSKLEQEILSRQRIEEALRKLTLQERERAWQLEQTLVELQRTQAQLVQNEKMASLGQLVAGVAHEINNPTSFIYGNIHPARDYAQGLLHLLQLYTKHYPNPVAEIAEQLEIIDPDFIAEDFPKLLASMQEGADRICQIVLSLRNFSRLDEGELKAVDIHHGIDNTLLILEHRLKPQPNRSEIQIFKNYGQLPLVECYPGQLNQVFMNLFSNAIDALEELNVSQLNLEGREAYLQPTTLWIWVCTEVIDQKRVLVRIADNGCGIAADVQAKIFDPFFTTKPPGRGTGLGLSISYRIVADRHGGKLWCKSTLGEGTEFAIELPSTQTIT